MTSFEQQQDTIDIKANYSYVKKIGEGAFGEVFKCIRKEDNLPVAIKIIKKEAIPETRLAYDDDNTLVPMEVYILKRLNHKNIAKLIEYYETLNFYVIVTESMNPNWSDGNIDLFEFLEVKGEISESKCLYILRQLADVITYMKSVNVFHLDIKDENIIIDDNFTIKLIDFGSSLILPPDSRKIKSFGGTLIYAPPEIHMGKTYDVEQSESWSLGVLSYILIFVKLPFRSKDEILRNQTISFPTDKKTSSEYKKFILKTLRFDPKKRLKLENLKYWLF